MTSDTLFYILISILIISFIVDKVLDALNAKHFNDALPEDLQDVYDETEYKKSQNYKATNYKFGILTSTFSIVLTLGFRSLPFFSTFGKIGDMSYGIYIYSFPIQQTLMFFFNLNTDQLIIYSLLASIVFGYLSWHLIEKKALRYK